MQIPNDTADGTRVMVTEVVSIPSRAESPEPIAAIGRENARAEANRRPDGGDCANVRGGRYGFVEFGSINSCLADNVRDYRVGTSDVPFRIVSSNQSSNGLYFASPAIACRWLAFRRLPNSDCDGRAAANDLPFGLVMNFVSGELQFRPGSLLAFGRGTGWRSGSRPASSA